MGKGSNAVLHELRDSSEVKRVQLLGYGDVPFDKDLGILNVQLPDKMPCEFSNCLKIHFRE